MKYLNIYNDESDTSIKLVELNRPEVKNAFNSEMIQEITDTFLKFNLDPSIRLVVLKGAGSVFCAGADLSWMQSMVNFNLEQNLEDSIRLWNMFESILFCEAPVVGIVHGAAFGGALGLLSCCDEVIALPDVKFCFSETKLGLSPAVISAFILRKISDAKIRPYMINAEVFSNQKAEDLGLVSRTAQNFEEALTHYKKYSRLGLQATKETKKLLNNLENLKMNQNSTTTWQKQKELTTSVIAKLRVSPEGQERLKNFLKKG